LARQPKFHKNKNFQTRLLSAALLIPLSLGLIYMGPPTSLILGGIVILCLFVEWGILCFKSPLPFLPKLLFVILGTFYVSFSIYWVIPYLALNEGWKFIYWLLFLVWSTDSFAYLGGRMMGGPKLAPSISPNKTWSGFMAGMVGGVLVGYSAGLWLLPGIFSFVAIIVLVFVAQAGDLLESQAKRWSQVKDSSSLIPGHGGFLDRLDSFLAVSFALALWQIVHLS
jgi:phosphatidate cytidylyltransferase